MKTDLTKKLPIAGSILWSNSLSPKQKQKEEKKVKFFFLTKMMFSHHVWSEFAPLQNAKV
eukprot:UN03285